MSPERWQQVESLYHDAQERPAPARAAWLAQACAGDEALRDEVEKLLTADESASGFMDAPAWEAEARKLAMEIPLNSLEGQQFSHYKILSKLGAGGMGEVYLARDQALERQVAIKVLPAAFTRDAERVQRFVREAKAASALNHPNIITIHEIGVAENTHFIAMEFIGGVTLRQRLAAGRLELRETLAIVRQMAAALDTAHQAGIIHRDLKPENVMLRPDGLVKVLDFGLARVSESRSGSDDPTLPIGAPRRALAESMTNPGAVMGTPRYMSPEQARGLKVDARTDVFSLGVVFYEMVTGVSPFPGATTAEVFAALLEKEPPPLRQFTPDAPARLEEIISRVLVKERDQRYATIRVFMAELEQVGLLSVSDSERWFASAGENDTARDGKETKPPLPSDTLQHPSRPVSHSASNSASSLSGGLPVRRSSRFRWLLAALLLAGALGLGWYGWRAPTRDETAFQNMAFRKLTLTGNVHSQTPAISPTGQYVAYVIREGEQQSLWMSDVNLGSQIEKVPLARVTYRGLTFARASDLLFYMVRDEQGTQVLYQLSVLGGKPQKVLAGVSPYPITFSPAGDRFAFINDQNSLLLARRDGSDQRLLLTHGKDEFLTSPAWSPDGQLIICGAASSKSRASRLLAVNAETGAAQPVASPPWLDILEVSWLPDGSALILNAVDAESRLPQIWQLGYPDGKARRITNDLNNYIGASLAADGGKLACIRRERIINLWVAPGGDANRARQLTSGAGREDGFQGLAWLPDGKIVYSSAAGGATNLWLMDAADNDNQPLTTTGSNTSPAVAPDGRTIVFVSSRTGNNTLWRMEPDGSNQRPLTDLTGDVAGPAFSPDGQWVIFEWRLKVDSPTTLWKVPLAGGSPVQLTTENSFRPVVAPDGGLIAFRYGSRTPTSPARLALLPLAEDAPLKTLELPAVLNSPVFKWTRDGRGLSYLNSQDQQNNLWSQPLNGGSAKQLTDFKTGQTFYFDWSHDGKQLACSRGTVTADVILISNFRQ